MRRKPFHIELFYVKHRNTAESDDKTKDNATHGRTSDKRLLEYFFPTKITNAQQYDSSSSKPQRTQ